MLFLPTPTSHMTKVSVGEACMRICKPWRGLRELINGNGLHVAWHRVKAQLLLLLLLLIVVIIIIIAISISSGDISIIGWIGHTNFLWRADQSHYRWIPSFIAQSLRWLEGVQEGEREKWMFWLWTPLFLVLGPCSSVGLPGKWN